MYPWYRGNGGKDFDLNADDILGVQWIYGMEDFYLSFFHTRGQLGNLKWKNRKELRRIENAKCRTPY